MPHLTRPREDVKGGWSRRPLLPFPVDLGSGIHVLGTLDRFCTIGNFLWCLISIKY
jgi:hypothetical protein